MLIAHLKYFPREVSIKDNYNGIMDRLHEIQSKVTICRLLPHSCIKNREGLRLYISYLGKYINHYSMIRNILSIEDLVIARISMQASLVEGAADAEQIETFEILRIFKLKNAQIAEHWEIISDFNPG